MLQNIDTLFHQLWSPLEGQLNEVLMVLFTAREEPAVSYR